MEYKQNIEGFHVTSYQINFASHHTSDRHVGFLSTWDDIGKSNKMLHYFWLSSYHITKLQQSDKNISAHSGFKFQMIPFIKWKVRAFFVVFSIPCCTKGNKEILQNHVCKCILCCTNPLSHWKDWLTVLKVTHTKSKKVTLHLLAILSESDVVEITIHSFRLWKWWVSNILYFDLFEGDSPTLKMHCQNALMCIILYTNSFNSI